MGCWVCCMHDPEREVRAAAMQAWQAAFSDAAKEAAGLQFCRKEIFRHLGHNLLVTPQSIKADQKTNAEDTEAIYEALMSSTLLAGGFVLRKLREKVGEGELAEHCSALLHSEVCAWAEGGMGRARARTRARAAHPLYWDRNPLCPMRPHCPPSSGFHQTALGIGRFSCGSGGCSTKAGWVSCSTSDVQCHVFGVACFC